MSGSEMSHFASTIMQHKYSHSLKDGNLETWPEIAHRQRLILKAVGAKRDLIDQAEQFIAERKFIPGGRYLYATGRPFHQVQNCLLLRAEDSREGWAELLQKSGMALMTGAGIGIDYSQVRPEGKIIRKTGGFATGPLALMQIINETGRGIMQGGSRRSAIWAGLNWSHPDIHKFITMKNWIKEVRSLKATDYNFPATMDGTNISVQLDDEFFKAYHDETHPKHSLAQGVYWATVRQMLKTAEPGFSVDLGKNARETLRNAPITAGTNILTIEGYKTVREIVGIPTVVWTGQQWASGVVFNQTYENAPIVKVTMTGGRVIRCEPEHPFLVEHYHGAGNKRKITSVERTPAGKLKAGDTLQVSMPEVPQGMDVDVEAYTLGYIYGDGSFGKGGNAEITFCTEESKVCAEVVADSSRITSTNPNDVRGYKRTYFKVDHSYFSGRNKETFPTEMYAASATEIRSFIAGLFDADGNYEPTQHRMRLASKHHEFLRGTSRLLEQIGILSHVSKAGVSTYGKSQGWQLVITADSVNDFAGIIPTKRVKWSDGLFKPYRKSYVKVLSVVEDGNEDVFCADVKVPEHSFMAEGVIISNCTEITSADDSDICNLGSINLARIESLTEMSAVMEVATAFLLAGTVYSDVPYAKVDMVRNKNRRLGLGIMGVHEFLMMRGKKYGADAELDKYLEIYAMSTEASYSYADEWELSRPVKTRAIAPTGTIGIIAETTTGMEPMLAAAYKRRYLKGSTWNYQYVVDPTAKRMVEEFGVKPEDLEDAYSLAEESERRMAFQAHLQKFVDHSISSTINLSAWGSELNNEDTVQDFGRKLIKYLPHLRGITCYPDGARSGQPLSAVKYTTASKHVGEVLVESGDVCDITKGGSCGS